MENETIKKIIKDNYHLETKKIEKIKNVYKIETEEAIYCLKVIKYNLKHFRFIIAAITHLQNRGFKYIPTIIRTINDREYINIGSNYAYLTKWVTGRESNYDNPYELELVSKKLAELHQASEGFLINTSIMNPRIGWFSWINVFETRKDEIADFGRRISQKAYKDDFDKMYSECLIKEIERAEETVKNLIYSDYYRIMDKEVLKKGFCHHDYANHNLIIMSNEINVIDFDYCMLDSSIHDICSLLIRAMRHRKWEKRKAEIIINSYSEVNEIGKEMYPLMKEFIRFPQEFWQIGLQRYWEQQPWSEGVFINRLKKYIDDLEDRSEFVEEFFNR